VSRWPGWVYDGGEEPDYRFSLANERTLLAWVRTALAVMAGGVAVRAVDLSVSEGLQTAMSVWLVALGMLLAVASWWRWASSERAMRRGEPLPSSPIGAVVAVGVLAVGALFLLTLVA
jgi:putative membrane protein